MVRQDGGFMRKNNKIECEYGYDVTQELVPFKQMKEDRGYLGWLIPIIIGGNMSKAKIISKDGYKCAPEGHTVIHYKFGDIVEGKAADWAVAAQCAKRLKPKYANKKLMPKLEDK